MSAEIREWIVAISEAILALAAIVGVGLQISSQKQTDKTSPALTKPVTLKTHARRQFKLLWSGVAVSFGGLFISMLLLPLAQYDPFLKQGLGAWMHGGMIVFFAVLTGYFCIKIQMFEAWIIEKLVP